jgi:hypothetical protein
MKKLLLTILFTLVLSGGAFAEILKWQCGSSSHLEWINWQLDLDNKILTSQFKRKDSKKNSDQIARVIKQGKNFVIVQNKLKNNKWNKNSWEFNYDSSIFTVYLGSKGFYGDCQSEKLIAQKKQEIQQEAIMFDIKVKREQCEAIGFKPETEKFADCVLRLVELDVKQQTQNQIVSAQNSGNDALVKQLERQNNLQSSQALINLGQQLMNPKQYNSNIYMPQTRRCTVSGFGVTSVVRCY